MIRADVAARRAAFENHGAQPPSGNQRAETFASQLRAKKVTKDDREFYQLSGEASVVDQAYEMWDMFGPYSETIRKGAFDKTLGNNPDVAFLVNHGGITMARTTAGTLELSTNPNLHSEAFLNPKRGDVKDLVIAVEEGSIDQMSFAFRITGGMWSPDWMEYYIDEVDIDRGDVSAVNYGANPYTTIAARAKTAFDLIRNVDSPALMRELQSELAARVSETGTVPDLSAVKTGRSKATVAGLLDAGLI